MHRNPRSSTLTIPTSSQPPQPSNDQSQIRPVLRSQPPKSVQNSVLNIPAPRKAGRPAAATTPQTQPPAPASRHKGAPSTASTSSESSSESSSSATSIASKKQKQPLPQLRRRQATLRPRSSTMSTPTSLFPLSPTKSLANNSPLVSFNRPSQRPLTMVDNSPSSSTGDSGSRRLPVTPQDGSEILTEQGRGVRGRQQAFRATEPFGTGNNGLSSASNSEMGLDTKDLVHRKSASHNDLKSATGSGSGVAVMTDEERMERKKRREEMHPFAVRPPLFVQCRTPPISIPPRSLEMS